MFRRMPRLMMFVVLIQSTALAAAPRAGRTAAPRGAPSPTAITPEQASQVRAVIASMLRSRHRPSLLSMAQLTVQANLAMQTGLIDGATAVSIVQLVQKRLNKPNVTNADIEALRKTVRPMLSRLPPQQVANLEAASLAVVRSAYPGLK